MNASIGRTVIYRHSDVIDGPIPNGVTEYPAIVTQVFAGRCWVNLIAFPPFAAPAHKGSRQEGDQPGDWHWPERV